MESLTIWVRVSRMAGIFPGFMTYCYFWRVLPTWHGRAIPVGAWRQMKVTTRPFVG